MEEQNKKKKSSGLLDRKFGNFDPKESYEEKELETKKEETVNAPYPELKRKFKYQKKNIKVAGDQMIEVEAIKRINNLTYNYEVIQLLIDNYVDNVSPNEQRRFRNYTELDK